MSARIDIVSFTCGVRKQQSCYCIARSLASSNARHPRHKKGIRNPAGALGYFSTFNDAHSWVPQQSGPGHEPRA